MAYKLSELNRTGIPPLLEHTRSSEDWRVKRAGIRNTWMDYIGGLPETVPVRLHIRERIDHLDYTRLHIEYDTAHGDLVTAYLLVPSGRERQRSGSKRRYPAVIAMHPTHGQGKADIATEAGRANRKYAVELVKRGYVVLAPDALTAGERIYPGHEAFHSGPFYEEHPDWSTVAKNITDHRQGIELLCSLEYVDPQAIGAIGHSFGAYNAYFLAGMDDRIKAVAASCGFSPFTGDPAPEHWSYRSFPYTHIPRIAAELQQDRIPFDFHEIAALCAPTPFFHYAGQEDHIFPHWKSVGEGMLELKKLYRLLGAEERFQSLIGAAGHDFPEGIRLLSYLFLDRWLMRENEHE
jgi:dienelactone hydrolase